MEKCPKRQKTLFFNVFWPKMAKNGQNELNGAVSGERTQQANERKPIPPTIKAPVGRNKGSRWSQ